jgi:tRNA-Thr(GGU) m(6)t(6)A37 methyltransferase TsaA
MDLKVIAYARNGFSQKFGIPRQSREESCIETHIIFAPAFRVREALRGIEEYSHLWLLWGFHEVQGENGKLKGENGKLDWSPTVRPPRLGGNKRMGVFATRSPFRPNNIGLTCVKLLRIEDDAENGLVLVVSGADLLNGTPIYDIKPYLAFSDSRPDAKNGFAEATKDYQLEVHISEEMKQEAIRNGCPMAAICEILRQDPRPAYQNNPQRVYYIDFECWTVGFVVSNANVCVKELYKK